MKLKAFIAAVAFLISSVAVAQDNLLLRSLVGAKATVDSIKQDMKRSDARRYLLDFLQEDMSEGILAIRREIQANPAMVTQAFPKSDTIQNNLEKILGTAYLNLQGDQLLADTILFENASQNFKDRIATVRNFLEPIREEYFKTEAGVTQYRKFAYVRYTLQALNQIRTMAPEALEAKPNQIKVVQSAANRLYPKILSLINSLAQLTELARVEARIQDTKQDRQAQNDWEILKENLKNISLSDGSEIDGNHNAVIQTQFNMELLKNMWGKQL